MKWSSYQLVTFLLCTRSREFSIDQVDKGLAFMELVVERDPRQARMEAPLVEVFVCHSCALFQLPAAV